MNKRLHLAAATARTSSCHPSFKAATTVSLALLLLSTTHSSLAYCTTNHSPSPLFRNNMSQQEQQQQQQQSSSSRDTSSQPSTTLPDMMRCIVFGADIGTYKTATRPVPTCRKNTLLVRVHAVGLNPVDAKVVVGDKLPHNWSKLRKFVHRRMVQDTVVGFDFAGVVVDTGHRDSFGNNSSSSNNNNNNSNFQPGDAVYGTMPPLEGSLAEYIAVPLDQVWHMSKYNIAEIIDKGDNIDVKNNKNKKQFQQAACLPLVGLTALQCLQPHLKKTSGENTNSSSNTTNNKSVLIVGASGGTGHVALQVARNLLLEQSQRQEAQHASSSPSTTSSSSLYHITAVCSGRNAEFVRQLGATHVVDYHHTDDNNLVRALHDAPGCPYDVVMDCVTSDDPRDTATFHYPKLLQNPEHRLLSANYVYRRLGGPTVDWIRASLARTLFHSQCWWYPNPAEQLFWIHFPKTVEELQTLKQWAEQGKLQVQIESVYDFSADGVQRAMQAILSRRVRGKVVVQVYSEADDTKQTANE